jgi:hypothetical protein
MPDLAKQDWKVPNALVADADGLVWDNHSGFEPHPSVASVSPVIERQWSQSRLVQRDADMVEIGQVGDIDDGFYQRLLS